MIVRALVALILLDLAACATISSHQFTGAKSDWRTRTGQLLYRTAKTMVIGDVVVRFSKTGDFELTFSKEPGIDLLVLRQDPGFAEIKGPLAGRGWSGPIDRAPQQLRGWLQLRDKIVQALTAASPSSGGQNRHQVRHISGSESFLFRF